MLLSHVYDVPTAIALGYIAATSFFCLRYWEQTSPTVHYIIRQPDSLPACQACGSMPLRLLTSTANCRRSSSRNSMYSSVERR